MAAGPRSGQPVCGHALCARRAGRQVPSAGPQGSALGRADGPALSGFRDDGRCPGERAGGNAHVLFRLELAARSRCEVGPIPISFLMVALVVLAVSCRDHYTPKGIFMFITIVLLTIVAATP